MIRTCLKLVKQDITISRLDNTVKKLNKDLKIDFYPIVGIKERKLGACVFNQPANQNMLTPEFADQLVRFLLSYQYDGTVENVWIQTKDNVFSHGADYTSLATDPDYLAKLSQTAIHFAKFNKPLFAQISGGAKGAGAYLLSMIEMPLGYTTSFLKLDECSRGMVPLMGGSHRLARLPLHLGYYLALTGDELNFEQMCQLGFIKGTISPGVTNSEIRKKFHEVNLYFRQSFRYMDFDQQSLLEAEEKVKVEQNMDRYNSELKYCQASLINDDSSNLNLRFAQNQHLVATVDYQNAVNPFSTFSEDGEERTINNYFTMRLERPLAYLKKHQLVSEFNVKGVELKRLDLSKIDHIFGKSSVEEIVKALEREKTEWAQRALRRIKTADPLAIRLTFELIKQAEKSCWISCLEREYSVAKKLIEVSRLKLKTFKKSSHYVFKNEHSSSRAIKIPQRVIDSFFEVPEGDYKLVHDVKKYSLLPVSDYYKDVPDSVRTYLNKQQFTDRHNSEQVPEILRFLNVNKINYKSKVFDVDILRQKVYEKLELQKEKERIAKRLGYLASHDEQLTRYMHERENFLKEVPEANVSSLVNTELHSIFKKKFEDRFAVFEAKTATMIGFEKKIELFKKVKDIILNNLLYKGHQYEAKKKGQSEYIGPIYFDKEGKDIYNSRNPYLDSDEALKQLGNDIAEGKGISEDFAKYEEEIMPKFTGTADGQARYEVRDHKYWAQIKERYDEKPQLWAEAYTYKELILQASRTSEQLAGYLEWSFQNFYDLLNSADKLNDSYKDFAVDMMSQVSTARSEKMAKLKAFEEERSKLLEKNIFSKMYKFQEEGKMREIFPYFFKQSIIPGQFRRSFLSVMDSTIKEFTHIYGIHSKKSLLVHEELGVLDQWINSNLASDYTDFLKHDVEYVTSYLQILFTKEILLELEQLNEWEEYPVELAKHIHEKFNVDFFYNTTDVTMEFIRKTILEYLYFLVDMHSNAKQYIKSPQAKLIDFMNRLKLKYQVDEDHSLPYSFEGLILLIGKDRKKIYDRFLGREFLSEPEFLQEYINREVKKTIPELQAANPEHYPKGLDYALEHHFNQHYNYYAQQRQSRRLIQNYFYYMMQFERYIHMVCGKQSFIPERFVSEEFKSYNQLCNKVISHDTHQTWLKQEITAVIEQLLAERYEVQKKLTKGELALYDQELDKKLKPENIKQLVKSKLTEEVFVVKNIFSEKRNFDFEATEAELSDEEYARTKREIKNPDALKKLNNLKISEEVFIEYMQKYDMQGEEGMTSEEKKFALKEAALFKTGYVTRLPFKSYHRMARDVFVYPEDMTSVPSTDRERELFKKINIKFSKSLAGEKIVLSPFTEEYKELNKQMRTSVMQEMVDKIQRVQSL